MHRGLSSAGSWFIHDVVVHKEKVVEQLKGKRAFVEARGGLSGKAEIADNKKDRPQPFTFAQDKLFYALR